MIAKKKVVKKKTGGPKMTETKPKKVASPELIELRREIKETRQKLKELKQKKKELIEQ